MTGALSASGALDRDVAARRSETATAFKVASITSVTWTPTREIDYSEWVLAGRRLGEVARCSQWWLGDWIRYGTARYGEKYVQAAKLTGYDVSSLRNMAYVASRFPDASRRRDKLSWSHHAELAASTPMEQDRWLDRAITERLSVADLRLELREARKAEAPDAARPDPADDVSRICPTCGRELPSSQRGSTAAA